MKPVEKSVLTVTAVFVSYFIATTLTGFNPILEIKTNLHTLVSCAAIFAVFVLVFSSEDRDDQILDN